jgi:hypothetical protein
MQQLGTKPFLQYTGSNGIVGVWVDARGQAREGPQNAPKSHKIQIKQLKTASKLVIFSIQEQLICGS